MAARPIHLTFGEFELDEARFELRRSGQAVAVQPKVLDLILHLARHRERVVTKEELLQTVWKGAVVTEASLSQALSLARRALDDSAEGQSMIRTVRSKGLQFIALERVSAPHPPALAPRAARVLDGSALETVRECAAHSTEAGEAPHLFAVLHCDAPLDGGACWSLADVDEVELGRGTQRRGERSGGLTRLLRIAVPGRLMSRTHARLSRTPDGWIFVDAGSRNGTTHGGVRADKGRLAEGDIIECGRTLFRFATAPQSEAAPCDRDSARLDDAVVPTVSPRLAVIDRDLRRVAATDLPVMLLGSGGVGKTSAAHALHARSGRSGPIVVIDARAVLRDPATPGGDGRTLAGVRGGTLLLENVDGLFGADVAHLTSALDMAGDVRLLSTSSVPMSELESRLPADLLLRLNGYRCVLLPLSERIGDLGLLVASVLSGLGYEHEVDLPVAYALARYPWPGNLRELSQKLKVAVTLSGGSAIRLEHLPPEIRAAASPS